jgi:hypothetical protein
MLTPGTSQKVPDAHWTIAADDSVSALLGPNSIIRYEESWGVAICTKCEIGVHGNRFKAHLLGMLIQITVGEKATSETSGTRRRCQFKNISQMKSRHQSCGSFSSVNCRVSIIFVYEHI